MCIEKILNKFGYFKKEMEVKTIVFPKIIKPEPLKTPKERYEKTPYNPHINDSDDM